MALHIRPDDLRDPRVALFLEEHLADMRRVSPPECVHALDLAALSKALHPKSADETAVQQDGKRSLLVAVNSCGVRSTAKIDQILAAEIITQIQ